MFPGDTAAAPPGTFTYLGILGETGQPQLLHADPLDVHLRLQAALGNGANQLLAATRNLQEPATAAQARLQVIEAVRQVFGLPAIEPLSGQGVPARQCEQALEAFLNFHKRGSDVTESLPTCSQVAPPGRSPDPAAL